eukprot:scaffold5075_cov296-Prasinococcus_capsulatus_cf.AAC.6
MFSTTCTTGSSHVRRPASRMRATGSSTSREQRPFTAEKMRSDSSTSSTSVQLNAHDRASSAHSVASDGWCHCRMLTTCCTNAALVVSGACSVGEPVSRGERAPSCCWCCCSCDGCVCGRCLLSRLRTRPLLLCVDSSSAALNSLPVLESICSGGPARGLLVLRLGDLAEEWFLASRPPGLFSRLRPCWPVAMPPGDSFSSCTGSSSSRKASARSLCLGVGARRTASECTTKPTSVRPSMPASSRDFSLGDFISSSAECRISGRCGSSSCPCSYATSTRSVRVLLSIDETCKRAPATDEHAPMSMGCAACPTPRPHTRAPARGRSQPLAPRPRASR